jgi:hypothetical protein
MKKSHLVILVAAMVLLSVFVWVFQSGFTGTVSEIVQFGVVFLVVTFGFYIGYRRLNSEKRGEPAEDELSRRMLRKASSLSFYVSLYIWLIVLYLTEESKFEGHTLVAGGILAMAASFVACWLFVKWRGLSNE